MRRVFLIITFLATTYYASARQIFPLSSEWNFSYGYDISPSALTLVTVPHTYNVDAVNAKSSYAGVANYLKDIELPYSLAGKRIFLKFNSVCSEAEVFVNGRFAGEHRGGYSAFVLEVTDFVRTGSKNSIWVRVNNSPHFSYLPLNAGFNQYGGITGNVTLIATEATSISLSDNGSEGIYIAQSKISNQTAMVNASVKINTTKAGSYTVSITAKQSDSTKIVARGEDKIKITKDGTAEIPLTIENPVLWDGRNGAHTYDFTVKLYVDKTLLDSMQVTTGLRYYAIDPAKGFMLNGKPYPLRGVTYVADRAGRGSALTHKDIEQDLEAMLEMGVTAVRAKDHPQDPYFYTLCDKYGIVVWSEIPLAGPLMVADNGYINKPSMKNSAREQLTEMILQRFNNPSVMFWGLFANLSVRGDSPVAFVGELNDLSHKLDPTRLTVATSDQDGDINYVTDLIGWSQYFGWNEGTVSDVGVWLSLLTTQWSQLKSAVGEYGAGGSLTHQDGNPRKPTNGDTRHTERYQTIYHQQFYPLMVQYPQIWGSFVNSMFDYGSATYSGGDTQGVCDMGLVTYDRATRKDAFYYYKSVWNKSQPFIHIADKRWQGRRQTTQSIKIFSNQTEVELVVNGTSAGKITSDNGVFRWEKIELNQGANRVEAISGDLRDSAEITITPQLL